MAHTWHLLGSPSPVLFRPKVIHPSLSLHLQGVSLSCNTEGEEC